MRSGCSTRSGGGLSFRRTARCESVLQLLELRHCRRILLSSRGALTQAVGIRAASCWGTAGNLTGFLRRGLRLILRLRRPDLILIRAGDRELRSSLRRIRRADRGILLRTIRSGLNILDDLPQRSGIVHPIQHSFAANQAQSLRIDAELLQHAVKLLQSLLRRSFARSGYCHCSRVRACGRVRDGRLCGRGSLRRR